MHVFRTLVTRLFTTRAKIDPKSPPRRDEQPGRVARGGSYLIDYSSVYTLFH